MCWKLVMFLLFDPFHMKSSGVQFVEPFETNRVKIDDFFFESTDVEKLNVCINFSLA
jgi:hypothetical protein